MRGSPRVPAHFSCAWRAGRAQARSRLVGSDWFAVVGRRSTSVVFVLSLRSSALVPDWWTHLQEHGRPFVASYLLNCPLYLNFVYPHRLLRVMLVVGAVKAMPCTQCDNGHYSWFRLSCFSLSVRECKAILVTTLLPSQLYCVVLHSSPISFPCHGLLMGAPYAHSAGSRCRSLRGSPDAELPHTAALCKLVLS